MELTELANLDNAAQLRLNLWDQRTLLNIAKVKLGEAELVVARDKKLRSGGTTLVTQAQMDLALAHLNALKSEVADRTRQVDEWAKALDEMTPVRTNAYPQLDR